MRAKDIYQFQKKMFKKILHSLASILDSGLQSLNNSTSRCMLLLSAWYGIFL